MAEAATLLGARRGIKVVGVDGSGMPDAETAASGGFLPSPHAKLAGRPSRSGSTPNPDTVVVRRPPGRRTIRHRAQGCSQITGARWTDQQLLECVPVPGATVGPV